MNREELNALREGWDFESKLAGGRAGQGSLPASLWETYSAMANTEGGLILLGAKERPDGSLDLRGIADIDKVERDLWNLLQNPQKVSANILRRDDVTRIEVDGRVLLLLHIPKAPRADRPVYINGAWERGTYLRVHEGDRRAQREVARRMLADAISDRDTGVVDGYTLADLNTDSVRRYREIFAARRPDHPFTSKDTPGFRTAIGAARNVRGEQAIRPTWAGLWMLESSGRMRSVTYTVKRREDAGGSKESLPLFDEKLHQSSPHSAASSPHSAASSPHSAASSPQKADERANAVLRVATGRRASPSLVREAILTLCADDFHTVAEIADILNRKPVTIQQNYVTKMVAEGVLEPLHPHTPNHPAQAYRARPSFTGGQP